MSTKLTTDRRSCLLTYGMQLVTRSYPVVYEIASRLSISNQDAPRVMLDRMLRMLAAHSVVTCAPRDHESRPVRVHELAPVTKNFILNEDKLTIDPWHKLMESMHEGGTPFNKVHRAGGFKCITLDDKFNAIFNRAVVDASTFVVKKMLKCYNVSKSLTCVIDVGIGGLGITLNMIRSKHPIIKGNNLDVAYRHKLVESMHEGGTPFNKVPRAGGFEYIALDDKFNAIFNKAVVDASAFVVKEMLKCYNVFESLTCVIDVGRGGLGITLNMIRSKHLIIKGINLDMPYVIQHAPPYSNASSFFKDAIHLDAITMTQMPEGGAQCRRVSSLG
ncbi:hypothetical protein OSB04_003927 [Centaurea solstitialis]|uniref:O-methyltransferase C-terminal domain-containing protein n=1 Tax=Centaurea solstitialis TaxID=347529 RepID=A0AA38U8B1_9ASTR|nr:hypothetical protein OSB04_003927 [Centaurea solstitialis]